MSGFCVIKQIREYGFCVRVEFISFQCIDIRKVACICSCPGDNEEGQKEAGAHIQCDWPG